MAATKQQIESFINMIAPIAQRQAKKHDNKIFPSICIAQACHESGYGTSTKMINANAVFGIKVGKSAYHFGTAWRGMAYKTGTTEYYDGKNPTKITDWFRQYDSVEDATEDYFDMLCHCQRYKPALNRATPADCIRAIVAGGYATGPDYAKHVMQIVNKYNLTQYDNSTAQDFDVFNDVRTVTANKLNVRYEPKDGRVLYQLQKDDHVHVVEEKDGWCRIEGWVSGSYLKR